MFKKLFKAVTSKEKDSGPARVVSSPDQLNVNDIVVFKYRTELPATLREQTLTVASICGYEYESGVTKEISLKDQHGKLISMSFENEDGEETICLSLKIPREKVLTLFDEDNFSDLFDDVPVELDVQQEVPEYEGWYAPRYTQTIKNATAYFHDADPGKEDLTKSSGGTQLVYHECESPDECFGVNVEVWPDGDTDVFLQVYIDGGAIGEMHPHG